MQVTKRNGAREDVQIDKIVQSISLVCKGLPIDTTQIAIKTVGGLYDGVTTKELSELSIITAANFISKDPIYGKAAGALLAEFIDKEVANQEIQSFSQSAQVAYDNGLLGEETHKLIQENKRKLNAAIKPQRNSLFDYFGIKTVYDRYLLRHPITREVVETPQYWLLRVACGLSTNAQEAVDFYNLLSSHEYMTSTPTLFNSGTRHTQMSSCYLCDSSIDDLHEIYDGYKGVALLSKFAGGVGKSFTRIRSSGSLIRGTNGKSNGIIPFLHTLSGSVVAVNQCFVTGTYVKVDDYIVAPIESLNNGDSVVTTSGPSTVHDRMTQQYEGKVVTIETSSGIATVTLEHPVLVIQNVGDLDDSEIVKRVKDRVLRATWVEAKDITTADVVVATVPTE